MIENQLHERRDRLWDTDKKSSYYMRKSGNLTVPQTIIRYMCVMHKKGLHDGDSKIE